MIKNSLLDISLISNLNANLDYKSMQSQNAITDAFVTSNASYNEASSVEDVLVNELTSLSAQLNSIKFLVSADNVTFVESFESLDFFDKEFHVDNPCALDMINRTLTLPEKATLTNKFVSVIVEPGSNGTYGKSLQNFANNDLNMIFDDSVSTMFEYERFTNAFTADPLILNLTLKLESSLSTNGLYVKLFSEEGIQNPTIESLSVSSDGVNFSNIEFTYSLNQNDYFIRYLSRRSRFIRISFKQQFHQQINTDFGINFRYAIAIRQIQSISTDYAVSGEYVSIPLISRNSFSTVTFSAVDDKVRFDDTKYFISANNGSKWIPVKNGEVLDLYKIDTGVPAASEVESIRVKIEMSKLITGNFINTEEVIQVNNDIYQLKNVPYNLTGMLGGHISYGDAKPLKVMLDIPNTLMPPEFNQECILDFPTKATVSLMPYYDGMQDDIEVKLNGNIISPINSESGMANFTFMPHTNRLNSIIVFNFTATGLKSAMLNSSGGGDGDVLQTRKTFAVEMTYKPFIYTREDAAISGQSITLPYPALFKDKSNINVEAIGFGDVPNQSITATTDQYIEILHEVNSAILDAPNAIPPTHPILDTLVDYNQIDSVPLNNNYPMSMYRVGTSTFPWRSLNLSSSNVVGGSIWVAKMTLETYQQAFSYSLTPKFLLRDNILQQFNTPKSWTVYGKAKMFVDYVAAVGATPAVPEHWDDVWVQLDNIKDYNWVDEGEVNFRLGTNCAYKEYLFIFTDSHFIWPEATISDTNNNKKLNIQGIHVNVASPAKLDPSLDFTLSDDKKVLRLSDSAYASNKDYKITYYHGIDITDMLPTETNTSSIKIPGIIKSTNPTQLVINYDYQNQALLSDIRYYSPICKEYRVTLI